FVTALSSLALTLPNPLIGRSPVVVNTKGLSPAVSPDFRAASSRCARAASLASKKDRTGNLRDWHNVRAARLRLFPYQGPNVLLRIAGRPPHARRLFAARTGKGTARQRGQVPVFGGQTSRAGFRIYVPARNFTTLGAAWPQATTMAKCCAHRSKAKRFSSRYA